MLRNDPVKYTKIRGIKILRAEIGFLVKCYPQIKIEPTVKVHCRTTDNVEKGLI